MRGKEISFDEDGIEQLLEDYSPSELDSQLSRVCPFFEDDTKEFTSVYGAIHRAVQSRLLVKLQIELDDLIVRGETEGEDGGRVDGLVGECKVSLNDRRVELRSSNGDEARDIAVIEVKTGNVSPWQAGAYAYRWNLPVIVAETKTGDAHLVDLETAVNLLAEAVDHQRDLEALGESGREIPDCYQCRDCGNQDCEYHRDGNRRTGNSVIRDKAKVLSNIDGVVEEIVSTIGEILESDGYTPVSDSGGEDQIE
ncbi:hypothetical protein AKJ58_00605 [candidate division MSBL1 archaeon SCGC-AAA385D11]|uniref:Uncharacterized protein n=1 Tax=candidate division MSBL1 archaeon SCGC-AAA385D11 TaxID=1698286 RepID=A0A133VP80_9EURY|nr:hypothetical protein AKJ58_00605 [candidate division MSBL1 archaeon SCGC-AAA385D11]